MKNFYLGLILFLGFVFPVQAIDPFVVEDIQVEGLERVSSGTVFNYLPVKVGDEVDDEVAREAIRALFGTGFFEDVTLSREGSTLVVTVEESPSIANVELIGLEELEDEQVIDGLNNLGLGKGRQSIAAGQGRPGPQVAVLLDRQVCRGY